MVFRIALGDYHHHALASAGEQNAVRVLLIDLAVVLVDPLPLVAFEGPVLPAGRGITQVGVPGDAGPVQLQAEP